MQCVDECGLPASSLHFTKLLLLELCITLVLYLVQVNELTFFLLAWVGILY